MMHGKFQSIEKSKTVDQSKKIISVWEKNSNPELLNMTAVGWKDICSFDYNNLEKKLRKSKILSIVVGDTQPSRNFLEALFTLLKKQASSARIYLYAEQKLERFISQLQKQHTLNILVRLGARPPADWIVFEQGNDAFLIAGQTDSERSFGIFTQQDISVSLFQSFYFLFWFTACQEAFGDQQGQLDFGAPLPAPFPPPADLKATDLRAGRLQLMLQFTPIRQTEIVVVPELSSGLRARKIVAPPLRKWSSPQPAPLQKEIPVTLSQAGSELVWFQHKLPQISLSYERCVLDLNGSAISLRLEWGKAQAIQLHHCLSAACSRPDWKFYPVHQLGKIKDDILIPGRTKIQHVRPQESIQLDNWESPVSLPYTPPARILPSPPALTIRTTYRWTESPESLPARASKDPIYKDWREIDEWARTNLNTIASTLSRLQKRCLQFSETADEWSYCNEEINELGDITPSQNAADSADQLDRIAQLNQDVEALAREIHRFETVQERLEIQKERSRSWEDRLKTRDWKDDHHKNDTAQKLQRYRDLEAELQSKQDALKTPPKHALFSKKLATQLQNEMRKLDKELGGLKKELEKTFAVRKATMGTYHSVLSPIHPPQLPAESPPSVGELYTAQGQRYLAVPSWETVPTAEKESQRLHAILVAKEVIKNGLPQEVW